MRSLAALGLVIVLAAADAQTTPARVFVWYRGTPIGTPQQNDLARWRAVGLNGVMWPANQQAGETEFRRMAAVAGLDLDVRDPSVKTRDVETIILSRLRAPDDVAAVAWRAVSRGTHEIAIDPGAPPGGSLTSPSGDLRPWVRPVVAVSRQISTNGELLGALHRRSDVTFDGPLSTDLDVALLEGERSFVVVATNTGRTPARASAHLPAGVRYALWVSLVDGSMMSMLREGTGAKWEPEVPPGAALAYVIDKERLATGHLNDSSSR